MVQLRATYSLSVWVTLSLALGVISPMTGHATESLPHELAGADILDRRGEDLNLAGRFTDHEGTVVDLDDFFAQDDTPVLMTLNYYECGSICNTQLTLLAQSLAEVDLAGDQFRVLTISIDPEESSELAGLTHASYMGLAEREDLDWHFMVGDQASITSVAESVGFQYGYDEDTDQFAHLTALFFISPDGQISQYLYGIDYPARDVKFALMEASMGTIGSVFDKVVLSCFHYVNGSYTPFAFGVMRVGGAISVVLLGGFLAMLWRRESARRPEAVPS